MVKERKKGTKKSPRTQLPPARLRLDRFWVEELSYKGLQDSEGSGAVEAPLVGESEILELEDTYLIRLRVKSRNLQQHRLPFRLAMVLGGHFTVRDEEDRTAGRRLAYINGTAMLYSLARVVLAMITGISSAPSQLPSINFAAFFDQLENEEHAKEVRRSRPARAKPRKRRAVGGP